MNSPPATSTTSNSQPTRKPGSTPPTPTSRSPKRATSSGGDVVTKKTDLFRIDLDWPTPDDFDLEVYLKKGDELVEVGSSGNQPGSKEQVELVDAVKGTYVIRVLNFASVSPSYTLTMGQYKGVTKRTKGEKESYTLTCEVDGKAKSSQKVFIDRGQVRSLDLRRACR